MDLPLDWHKKLNMPESPTDQPLSPRRNKLAHIGSWLSPLQSDNAAIKYSHLLLTENVSTRPQILVELTEYFESAYQPAKIYLRKILSDDLHPLGPQVEFDPAHGFPKTLEAITLQGYFGEIFTGIIAEHYEHFGSSQWEVPIFLFHTHIVVFQQLELARQTGGVVGRLPGRTGDDCVAFERDDRGDITRIMICESKCTQNHSSGLVNDNLEKLSAANLIPVDLLRIIEALKLYDEDDYARQWAMSLKKLLLLPPTPRNERCDLSGYVCGKAPRRNATWISQGTIPDKYSGGRKLKAVEAHLEKVDELVRVVHEGLAD